MPRDTFIIVPLLGYATLWLLGSLLFLAYFRLLGVPLDVHRPAAMVAGLPAPLAIATVPVCGFIAFFVTTRLSTAHLPAPTLELLLLGAVSLVVTVVLDLLITVLGEHIDIRAYPINVMYVLAWLVIVPAVLLGGS